MHIGGVFMYYFGLRTTTALYWVIVLILIGTITLGFNQGYIHIESTNFNNIQADFNINQALPWWIGGIFSSGIILAFIEIIGLLERIRNNTDKE
jgi:hypothetical protein